MIGYKIILAIFLALFSVCTAASIDDQNIAPYSRVKRQVFSCPMKLSDAIKKCSEVLSNELEFDDEVSKQIKEDTPGDFRCCYYAKFTHCVRKETGDECEALAKITTNLLSGGAALLQPKCDGYEYPSAKCIFFVWFYYIIAAIVIVFLLSLGCCIARCICGRK